MLILKGRFSKSYVAQSSKFCLRQQLFAFNEFYMETRLSNIIQIDITLTIFREKFQNHTF